MKKIVLKIYVTLKTTAAGKGAADFNHFMYWEVVHP